MLSWLTTLRLAKFLIEDAPTVGDKDDRNAHICMEEVKLLVQ